MAKYLLLFHGGSMPESEEEGKAVMAAWGTWFGTLGAAVADPGNPSSAARTVNANGSVSSNGAPSASGYTILEADSLDAAVEMTKSCPVLAGGASVEVVETFEAM